MFRVPLLLSMLFLLAAAGPAPDASPEAADTTENWMWSRIQAGRDADFNERCGTERLDANTSDDPRWVASCRAITPAALRALLVRPGLADAAPHGVRLRGARIDGTLNLDDAHVTAAEFTLIDSLLAGDLILSTAHLDGALVIDGTVVAGRVNAGGMRIDRALVIQNKSRFTGIFDIGLATLGESMTIQGAILAGGMNAVGVQVGSFLTVDDAAFDGDLTLVAAKIQGAVVFGDVRFRGGTQIIAGELQVGSFFVIQKAEFSGQVNLAGGRFGGEFVMNDTNLAAGKQFTAAGLQVAGLFAVTNVEFGGGLLLSNANLQEDLTMAGVKFPAGAAFDANGVRVGGSFRLMTPVEFTGGINLTAASIRRQLDMVGAHTGAGKTFSAIGMQVGGDFLLRDAELGGDVNLRSANVLGQFDPSNTALAPDAALSVENMHVGQDFFFRDARSAKPVNALALVVAGSLDMRGSTLGGLDLSGAVVNGDLRLGGRYDDGTESWTRWASANGVAPVVVLRNASVANLQDDERSWEGSELLLEGFTYKHLGGAGGVNRQDMRHRPVAWWRDWLERDHVYSPQPYTQLASVLAASGNSDAASEIRFAGRDRERREMLHDCVWRAPSGVAATDPVRVCNFRGWLGLSVLQATIGYGIGIYTFRALWWTLGLTLVGTIILSFAPGVRAPAAIGDGRGVRRKPLLWCFGATLNHVLPVVSLSPEFNAFFDDPKGESLYAWQKVVFAVLALCGWALSFFVVAAISGLTQT